MGVAHWQHQPQRILGSHRKSVPSERIRLFINISRITREWATRCYGLRVYLWGEKLRQGLKLHRNRLGGVIMFRFRAEVQLIGAVLALPALPQKSGVVAPTYDLSVPEVGDQTTEVQGYPCLLGDSKAGHPEIHDKIKFRFQVIWQASEQEPPGPRCWKPVPIGSALQLEGRSWHWSLKRPFSLTTAQVAGDCEYVPTDFDS